MPLERLLIHLLREELQPIATHALDVVHGNVRIAHERGVVLTVAGIAAHADARAGHQAVPADHERRRERLHDGSTDNAGIGRILQLIQDHHEFIAAQPRQGVAVAHALFQALRDPAQQIVAHVVASRATTVALFSQCAT